MGLPSGWVTNPHHGLTSNQQLAALGNGVLPAQGIHALQVLFPPVGQIIVSSMPPTA